MTGNGGNIVQKELNETVVRSREEIEERLETEDRQQLGDISDEVYMHPRHTHHLNSTCACRGEYGCMRILLPGVARREKVALFVPQRLRDSSRLIARASRRVLARRDSFGTASDIHFASLRNHLRG